MKKPQQQAYICAKESVHRINWRGRGKLGDPSRSWDCTAHLTKLRKIQPHVMKNGVGEENVWHEGRLVVG